jgi:peptidoglycan-N-acetylglucosamine deacetylase
MTIIPHRTPSLLTSIFPTLLWRMPEHDQSIYLTFDDGPIPGPTEFVLETLKKFQAKATFFCIGENIEKHPFVFNEIVLAGHSIGNHTFNHLKGWSTSSEKYFENVRQCDAILSASTENSSSNLFRPPYGRITYRQIKLLHQYKIVMWDVLSLDYMQSGSAERFLSQTINATRPGSIVVFHDSLKAENKLRFMLPKYLEHFDNLGFQFKSL